MHVRRFIAVLTLIVMIGVSAESQGQIMGRPGQAAGQVLGGNAFTNNPDSAVFDPGNLEYDMQPFAPLDISEFDGPPDFSGGFFATFDRSFLNVRRPRPFGPIAARGAFPRGSDWQSGNQFTVGYMNADGAGWDIKYLRTSGSFFNGPAGIANPMLVTTSFHKFELNRAFRQRLSRGGFIEAYFGLRYDYLQDKSIEDDSEFIINNNVTPPVTGIGINRFTQSARNSIVGGGVGFRLFNANGRWAWRTNTGLNGGYNSQTWNRSDAQFLNGALANQFTNNAGRGTFTPSLESSAEITYSLTRDVSLRAGAQLSYMFTGIHRAHTALADLNPNSAAVNPAGSGPAPSAFSSQASVIGGFTLGIEWRR